MSESIIIFLLLVCSGFGLYHQDRRFRDEAAELAGRIAEQEKEIAKLQAEAEKMRSGADKRRAEAAERRRIDEENDVTKIENQIRYVSKAALSAKKPVNSQAVQVLYALEDWVHDNHPDWRVSFEVAMGAFIGTAGYRGDSHQDLAFRSYNSKRVDFLLIDGKGLPKLVVEYNGTGHDLSGDASDRMRVKRLALSRAGIPLVEIPARATKAEILQAITL